MMIKKIICLLAFSCIYHFCFAQNVKDIKSISLQYDRNIILEVFNQLNIGCKIYFVNGKTRSTPGLLNGNYSWKNFSVQTAQGKFDDGAITFSRRLVAENNNNITVNIQVQGRKDLRQSFNIPVPKVTAIHFNLYADSLKRDVEFDLNVQGIFSSGKSYPLDTSDIIFTTSAGKLLSNNLWLSLKDTAVHFIKVSAVYKLNSSLTDNVIIPVKQPAPDAPLPSEKSILKKYGKKQ